MKGISVFRFVFGTVLLGLAMCVQAQVNIFLASSGLATANLNGYSSVETVFTQVDGFGPLIGPANNLSYTVNLLTSPISGMGTYTGPGGSMTFSFQYLDASLVGPALSYEGVWQYDSGTGTYANLTGQGTLSETLLIFGATAESGTVLAGAFQTVPEPAPVAALSLCVLGMFLSRRKKV